LKEIIVLIKVEVAQPINGEVEIDSYAFGERVRDNANLYG